MKRKLKIAFQGTQEQLHHHKKEVFQKSVVHEIQCFLKVKEVAAIAADYAIDPQLLLRFLRTQKELVDLLTGQIIYKWSGGVSCDAKSMWVKELDGLLVLDSNRISFISLADGSQRFLLSWPNDPKLEDFLFYAPLELLLVSHWEIGTHLIRILVYSKQAISQYENKNNRHISTSMQHKHKMLLINGNVCFLAQNIYYKYITVNIWSPDLQSKLVSEKTIPTHNWPILLNNMMVCSSSKDHFDQFYQFTENGCERVLQQNDFKETQYGFSGSTLYKIFANLVCQPIKTAGIDGLIQSVFKTRSDMFIVQIEELYQKPIYFYQSYKVEKEGELRLVVSPQLVQDVTHCLLLN